MCNSNLDEHDRKGIFRMIVRGLAHCHEKCIIHHDIKPDNILVDYDEKKRITDLRLADFGLCLDTTVSDEGKKDFCGTLKYMAPELLYEGG